MSDDSSKTEQPTPKKIRDARKEGNVAQSRDLSMLMVLTVAISFLLMRRHAIVELLSSNYLLILQQISLRHHLLPVTLGATAWQIIGKAVLFLIPLIVLAALTAMITTIFQQGGMLLTNKLFKFELKKFNIVNNAKQIFAKKNLIKFAMNCIKLVIFASIGYNFVKSNIKNILLLTNLPLPQMISFFLVLFSKILFILLAIYCLFAFLDFFMEKRAITKQLMMSLEEIKKEHKESEGNPEVKGRRKELHRELLEDDDGGLGSYKDSMLVLANPTHIAIVIIYMPTRWKMPIMIYKAKAYYAQQVFHLAKRWKVPIIHDRWLARQMYALAEINKFIPHTLMKPIAEVIAQNLHLRPQIAADIAAAKQPTQHQPLKTPELPRSQIFSNKSKYL